jgi:hypothetical protein
VHWSQAKALNPRYKNQQEIKLIHLQNLVAIFHVLKISSRQGAKLRKCLSHPYEELRLTFHVLRSHLQIKEANVTDQILLPWSHNSSTSSTLQIRFWIVVSDMYLCTFYMQSLS